MLWSVPKIWEGGECFILGGGGSLPLQFGVPEEVIKDVHAGKSPTSAYSEYLSAIHNKRVIAINVAYLIGRWMDIIFFGDNAIHDAHWQGFLQHPAIKVTCCDRKTAWVKHLKKDKKQHGISVNPTTVCWNQNSGGAAISLAAHLGVKRIILLGFDMRLDQSGKQHFHNVYNGKVNTSVFAKHLKGFPIIAQDAKRMGIEILNANPDSGIHDFKKVKLTEVL